jgi:hypothetical protein
MTSNTKEIEQLVKKFAEDFFKRSSYDMREYDPFLEESRLFVQQIVRKCIEAAGDPGDELIKGDAWHDGVRASVLSIQQEFGLDHNFGIES